jgi:opacity protein-like surface antigen
MKKVLLFLVLAVGVNSSALLFSDEVWLSESWASLGSEYGSFFERYSEGRNTVGSYTFSSGINFGGYRFFHGKRYGIFLNGLLALPVISDIETNGVITRNSLAEALFSYQVGLIFGPGFRLPINNSINFRFGVGASFLLTDAACIEYIRGYGNAEVEKLTFSLGIGGDVGFKFDITNNVFLSAGSIVTFAFASYMNVDTPYGNSSGWAKDYFMFSLRPYIAIGINLYWDSTAARVQPP